MTPHAAAIERYQVPVPPSPPRPTGRRFWLAIPAVGVLVLAGLCAGAPNARSESIGGVYSIDAAKRASEVIQEHSGDVATGVFAASTASAACGPIASIGCVALVNGANAAYQSYAAAINTAARTDRCVVEYFGETAGGGVNGVPYVAPYSGPGCRPSGPVVDMNDDILHAMLNGDGH